MFKITGGINNLSLNDLYSNNKISFIFFKNKNKQQ